MENLKARIEQVIAKGGWTSDAKTAKVAGVSRSAVSQWRGKGRPGDKKQIEEINLESAKRLAEATGFSAFWIANGTLPKLATPQTGGGAVSTGLLLSHTVPVLKTAREIMDSSTDTTEEFRFALVDDAMAPAYPKGLEIIFSPTRKPQPGKPVLIQTVHGELHVRSYAQGRTPDTWGAAPEQPSYATFDSSDGILLRGVFRGTYEPD